MSELPKMSYLEIAPEQIDDLIDMIDCFSPHMEDAGIPETKSVRFELGEKLIEVGQFQSARMANGMIAITDLSLASDAGVVTEQFSMLRNFDHREAWATLNVSPRRELTDEDTWDGALTDLRERLESTEDETEKDLIKESISVIKQDNDRLAGMFGLPGHGFTQDKYIEVMELLGQIDPEVHRVDVL